MEEASNDDSRTLIDSALGSAVFETVVVEQLREVRERISSAIQRVEYLMCYIAGLYYTDQQRQMAEAQVFKLQKEIARLASEEVPKTLAMPTTLYEKVTVNT